MIMVIQVTKNFCFYVNRQLLFFGLAAGLLGVIVMPTSHSYADEQSYKHQSELYRSMNSILSLPLNYTIFNIFGGKPSTTCQVSTIFPFSMRYILTPLTLMILLV